MPVCFTKGSSAILSLPKTATKGSGVPIAGHIPPPPIGCQSIRRRDGSRVCPAFLAPSSTCAARQVAARSGAGESGGGATRRADVSAPRSFPPALHLCPQGSCAVVTDRGHAVVSVRPAPFRKRRGSRDAHRGRAGGRELRRRNEPRSGAQGASSTRPTSCTISTPTASTLMPRSSSPPSSGSMPWRAERCWTNPRKRLLHLRHAPTTRAKFPPSSLPVFPDGCYTDFGCIHSL